jgi:hypothetical protein
MDVAHADELVTTLMRAETSEVPTIVAELNSYQTWSTPKLHQVLSNPKSTAKQRLHASLALVSYDPQQLPYLTARLLTAEPLELLIIRQMLWDQRHTVNNTLWAVLADQQAPGAKRLRAAGGLALLDADNPQWQQPQHEVVRELVLQDHLIDQWIVIFRPLQDHLAGPLKAIFVEKQESAQGHVAALLLASFLAQRLDDLVQLVQLADDRQLGALGPVVASHDAAALTLLRAQLTSKIADQPSESAKEALAKRQTNAALTLLMLGHEGYIWPL